MTPELGRGGAEAAHQPSEGSEGSARAVRHRALDVPGSGILNGRAQRPDRPTGDRARDMNRIRAYYRSEIGDPPEGMGPIRLRHELPAPGP